jgi:hypothetical protein
MWKSFFKCLAKVNSLVEHLARTSATVQRIGRVQ